MNIVSPLCTEDILKIKKLKDMKETINKRTDYKPVHECSLKTVFQYFQVFTHVLNNISAVYFLLNEGEIFYVGQTTDLWSRTKTHLYSKQIDEVKYLKTKPEELRELEEYYIIALDPTENDSIPEKIRKNKERYDFIKEHANKKTLKKHKIK